MQKALDCNLNNNINEFYELRNLMNTWSQHKNYTNLLLTGYECKPVKRAILGDLRRAGNSGQLVAIDF